MRRFRFVIPAVVLFWVGTANADRIPIFYITSVDIGFMAGNPNSDIGTMGFSFKGPGISIFGDGTFDCTIWCSFFNYESAGFPIDIANMTTTDYFAQIRGLTYYSEFPGSFSSPWTFDTDFTVPGPEASGMLNNGLILGQVGSGNNVFQFYLKVPPGTLDLGFLQSDVDPSLYTFGGSGDFFAQSTVTPEPGTIILTVTGMVAIGALVRKKHFSSQANGCL
jgi:hypothetical protein